MGLRRGWLVAMMCAVGDGCDVDGGAVLDGAEGAAWATVTVVGCVCFVVVGGVAVRLFFWAGRWARVAELGCGRKPWLWSAAVAKVGTGRGGATLAACVAALALAARAI